MKVSIPYRQATDGHPQTDIDIELEFQFLIGRLRTKTTLMGMDGDVEFQFLIGRLRTCVFSQSLLCTFSFNSL